MSVTVDDYEWTQNLSHEVCGVITSCGRCAVQLQCVNVVIGVVLGDLHVVVHVIPLVVCADAVIRRTLVLIAFHRSDCFHRSHFT